MTRVVLTVGAHPDDIELAMGGTVARYVAEGARVVGWIGSIPDQVECREQEARAAAESLGMEAVIWTEGRGKQVDQLSPHRVVAALEAVVAAIEPDVAFVPAADDLHQDHRLLASAAMSALRRAAGIDVIAYGPHAIELGRPRSFRPSLLVDVGAHWGAKLDAVALHRSQFERDVAANWRDRLTLLAQSYGAQAGVELAEGFDLIRQLW